MQNRNLIDKTNCLTIPCQLSIQEYVENQTKNRPQFETWEYEKLLKQRMDWDDNIVCSVNEEKEENDESNKNIDLSNGPEQWQQIRWENDVFYDEKNIKSTISYCVPQLAREIFARYRPLQCGFENFPLKIGKSSSRRTVLDYYPVSVNQNRYFLDMDRRFFPIVFSEDDAISKQIAHLPSTFHTVSNGEATNIPSFDFDQSFTITAGKDRIFFYETSEQHSPFRMQSMLTSELVAYSNNSQNFASNLGVTKQIKRKSPFFGSLSDDVPFQLALENDFFRVPIYEHQMKSTDFLLFLNGDQFAIRKFDGLFLGGKQMPLMKIHNPKSMFFQKIMMRVVFQLFIDHQTVPVELLASILSNIDFINIESDLQKIAVLSSDKKFWRLKSPISEIDGFYGNVEIEQYMIWAAIFSYLNSYEYVQPDKKLKKSHKIDKKKQPKNPFSPWSISKSYLNGIHRGFWKLENFEQPTKRHQMDSFMHVTTLVPKRIINEKTDLRKLTVYETNRLLKKFRLADFSKKKKMKRWALVNHLSTHAATDLGGNADMEKYARDTKTNRRNIRMKYIQQCQATFEANRIILSNQNELESENECSEEILKAETKDITIEDFQKYLKESFHNPKKTVVNPVIFSSENVKQLIENPLAQFIIYRKKGDVVKKEKYLVNDYVLNYLKHAKSGRFGKKLYGIGDLAKKEKQQLRDKLRRQENYKKKRIEMNLPVDVNCQDTTDKICSSCGRKGHIRTNQECPNFNKFGENLKQKFSESNEFIKSTPAKPKLLKQESNSSTSKQNNQLMRSINKKKAPAKRFAEDFSESESQIPKKPKVFLPHTDRKPSVKRVADDFDDSVCHLKKKPKMLLSLSKNKDINTSISELYNDDNDDFIINDPYNSEIINTKKTNKISRKKTVKKKANFSACAAPFGDEPIIFQSADTVSPNRHQSSSDDASFEINIPREVLEQFQNDFVYDKPSKELQSDTDSDEYIHTIPMEQWHNVPDESGEKENINRELDEENWNCHDNDDDDDDEFTINFSLID